MYQRKLGVGRGGVNCYVFLTSLLVECRVPSPHLEGGIFGKHWPKCRAGLETVKKDVYSPDGNRNFVFPSVTSHTDLVKNILLRFLIECFRHG